MRTSKAIGAATHFLEERLLKACDESDEAKVKEYLNAGANMNVICRSGRTPFCTAAHLGHVGIFKAMVDNALKGKNKTNSSDKDIKYLTDSNPSSEDETLPAEKVSAAKAGLKSKENPSSENGTCNCGKMRSGGTCKQCLGKKSVSTKFKQVSKSVHDENVRSLKKNNTFKYLPKELQILLGPYISSSDTESEESEESDPEIHDYGPDLSVIHRLYPPPRNTAGEGTSYGSAPEVAAAAEGGDGGGTVAEAAKDGDGGGTVAEAAKDGDGGGTVAEAAKDGDGGGTAAEAAEDGGGGAAAAEAEGGVAEGEGEGEGEAEGEAKAEGGDGAAAAEAEAEGNTLDGSAPLELDDLEEISVGKDEYIDFDALGEITVHDSPELSPARHIRRILERNAGPYFGDLSTDDDSDIEAGLPGQLSDEGNAPEVNTSGRLGDIQRLFNRDLGPTTAVSNELEFFMQQKRASNWRTGVITGAKSLSQKVPNRKSLNERDYFGCTALHYATMGGHIPILKILIEGGCTINLGDTEHLSPVHMASAKINSQTLRLLIRAGADVNVFTSENISPLHIASCRGLLNNVKILVRKGADIDAMDGLYRSSLFMAVTRSHKEVVAYLAEHGAKTNTRDLHGRTPLHEAINQQNMEIFRILVAHGAELNLQQDCLNSAIIHKNEELVSELIKVGSLINATERYGDTPLITAAKTLQPGIVKVLLENGALVNLKNRENGDGALVQMTKNLEGQYENFEKILSLFLEFDLEIDHETGYKALRYAIYNAEDAVAALLIRRGAITFKSMSDAYDQLATDLFLDALVRENRLLLKLLIYAGYNFRSVRIPERISPSLMSWIKHRRTKPLKLGELCRIVVRSKLRNKVFERVAFLNLPSSIQSYIRLENVN